jgi:hypothetical protein
MNEQQPYEKHLADKLQHLPPPGEMNRSWEQMRTLLDKEMPRGGGMPIHRRWWIFGIAIGVLFVATWLSGESFLKKKEPATAHKPAANNDSIGSKDRAPATGSNQPVTLGNGIEKSRGEPVILTGEKENAAGNTNAANPEKNNLILNDNKRDKTNTAADDAITTHKNNRTENNLQTKETATVKNNRYSPSGKKKTQEGSRPNSSVPGDNPAVPGNEVVTNKRTGTDRKPGKTTNDTRGTLATSDQFWSKPFQERVRPTTVKAPLRYIDSKPAPALYPAATI